MDFGEKVIPFIEISESKKIRKTYCIPIFKIIDPLTAEPCLGYFPGVLVASSRIPRGGVISTVRKPLELVWV